MERKDTKQARCREATPEGIRAEAETIWLVRGHRTLYESQIADLKRYAECGCTLAYYPGWQSEHFLSVCRILRERERGETLSQMKEPYRGLFRQEMK